jgi:hypothetical protein
LVFTASIPGALGLLFSPPGSKSLTILNFLGFAFSFLPTLAWNVLQVLPLLPVVLVIWSLVAYLRLSEKIIGALWAVTGVASLGYFLTVPVLNSQLLNSFFFSAVLLVIYLWLVKAIAQKMPRD